MSHPHHIEPVDRPKIVGDLPLPPLDSHLMGDAVQDAYDAMMAARQAALNVYGPANDQQAADAGQYNTDNAAYNAQVQAGTLVDPNKTTVFNALGGAYNSWVAEDGKIDSAFDNFGAGDAKRQQGLNEQNPMIKISLFNSAKGYYNTAKSRSDDCPAIHTTFVGYISTAEAILY